MKNELDSKFLLKVFDKIRQHGKKDGEKYQLNGITAFTDLEGYNVFVEDAKTKLQFGFHNQYPFAYPKPDAFDQFEKKLKQIDKEY